LFSWFVPVLFIYSNQATNRQKKKKQKSHVLDTRRFNDCATAAAAAQTADTFDVFATVIDATATASSAEATDLTRDFPFSAAQ